MKYIKQLDSIRAIAVLLVIICHWVPPNIILMRYQLDMLGALGVDIFFVLSGFLISSILLGNRDEAEASSVRKPVVLKNFYLRRALRIFPIFYLLLFILFILRYLIPEIWFNELFYGATYTINFYFYKNQYWPDYTVHLWSLSVEEQFYLIWPLILLFINRKFLLHAIIIFILVGMTGQLMSKTEFGYLLTHTSFDAFGLGALLAWIIKYKPASLDTFYRYLLIFAVPGAVIFLTEFITDHWLFLPQRTLHALCALLLITHVIKNKEKVAGIVVKFLSTNLLAFIGRISYGIYLYHLYIPWLRQFLLRPLIGDYHSGLDRPIIFTLFFILDSLLLLTLALLSWKFIEQPILTFKKYFAIRKPPAKKITPLIDL